MRVFLFLFFSLVVFRASSQSLCADALRLCSETSVTLPITQGVQTADTANFGCLSIHKNPVWLYFQVGVPGTFNFSLHTGLGSGSWKDVDFIAWGPLQDSAFCDDLDSALFVDCGYSSDSVEYININATDANSYYVIMISNYSDQYDSVTIIREPDTGTMTCSTVGTRAITGNNDALAYPNPFKDIITIKAPGYMSGNCTMTLYDLTGRVIRKSSSPTGTFTEKRNGLNAGTYLYMIDNGSKSVIGKIVANDEQ